MKTREQNRNNKRTEIERFDWFIERIQTRVAFGWLSERSAEKTSCPKNFLEIALTSYYNTIGQSNNAFSILGFFWRENEESMFFSFQPLADKTNNEHLPKPCFKDIRKSLYQCFVNRVAMTITDMITQGEFACYLSTSPHKFCRKWIGATNENSNFDLRVKRVNYDLLRSKSVPHSHWLGIH